MKRYVVSLFSAGVSSAVSTKMAINEINEIIYTHIDDQHPDTMRFIRECELWFGKPVTILQSAYKNVETAIRSHGYVNGIAGAPCTKLLKRRVRKEWERTMQGVDIAYVWGMDVTEGKRAEKLKEHMPEFDHIFPLIDKSVSKQAAHEILSASGIKRPVMYDLGYHNNNCIGCVKGGKGYWNKIRVDFPDVFAQRAKLERDIGASCLKKNRDNPGEKASPQNTVRLFLDELDPEAGRAELPICDDCGIMCELISLT